MRRAASLCLVLVLAVPAGLSADPRFWQHDRAVSPSPGAQTNPDVALAGGDAAYFVAWQEETGALGSEIYLAASFDAGCTWCGPVLWATGSGAEVDPRVAAGVTPDGHFSVQMVFRRGSFELLVASDASLDATATSVASCSAFAALATPAPIALGGGPFVSRAEIAAAEASGSFLHFHATWMSEAGPTDRVMYRHDLAGDGSGWASHTAVDLFATLGEIGIDPAIAADTVGDSSTDSAATIMYRNFEGSVKMTRSSDSGLTWSAPFVVSGTPALTHAADSSTIILGDLDAWSGAAWQVSGLSTDIRLDAAHWSEPLVRDVEFNAASDHLASSPAPSPGLAPALSIGSTLSPFAFPYGLFVFWPLAGSESEIVSRGGVLDAFDAGAPRNLDRFPFAAQRRAPADPASSLVERHSNCVWDDGWPLMLAGVCAPAARPAGSGARTVASADGLDPDSPNSRFVTVFSDDRSGTSQIYWKQTDDTVRFARIDRADGRCEGGTAGADLLLDLTPQCPGAPERMERYLIYYGSVESDGASPSGPFVKRLELSASGLSSPAVLRIDGLNEGETYHFALIPEDEARNITPPDFDPRADDNSMLLFQLEDALMPTCGECLVGDLSPVAGLKGVKAVPDARFEWEPDPSGPSYHLNSVASKGAIREPDAHRPSVGIAVARCTTSAPSCSHPGALAEPTSPLYYQVFSACDVDGASEGPL